MWTNLQDDTKLKGKIMGCQVHTIKKAKRSLFTDHLAPAVHQENCLAERFCCIKHLALLESK